MKALKTLVDLILKGRKRVDVQAPVVVKGPPPHRSGAQLAAPFGHEAAEQDAAHELRHHGKDQGIELGEVEPRPSNLRLNAY